MRSRKTKRAASSANGFWFDEAAAQKAVDFFAECLRHTKGEWAGQPFALEPWQRDDVIRPLFGWKRTNGQRRYRTVYVEVPRKNGKSTLAAGIALYLTFADGEPGAEVYSAAADRDQAAIVFEAAKGMVDAEPELANRADVYRRSIVVQSTGSSYKVLSADAPTKHGLNAHGVVIDELHAQPNRDLYDVLVTSTGARRQPVVFMITTAGFDRNSVCWELHEYARKVRDGVIEDDAFLPVIYQAEESDDWTTVATWKKANPSLGRTVKLDYLAAECDRAQEVPGYQNTFRRLHLCQWTEQSTRWLDMALWDKNDGDVPDDMLLRRIVYMALDLGSTTDLSALAKLFPLDDGRFVLRMRFWMPADNVQKRVKGDHVPYDVWIRQGFITPTPGNITDYDFIQRDILAEASHYRLKELAYDRWNANQLVTHLQAEWPESRPHGPQVVPFGQGFASMSAPTKEFEKLLLGERLLHGGNPVLRWMASNVSVKQDPAGNLKPDKMASHERIDGIVTAVMALGRAMVGPIKKGSVYETRDPIAVTL